MDMAQHNTDHSNNAGFEKAPPFLIAELIDGESSIRRHGLPILAVLRFSIAAALSDRADFILLTLPELHLNNHIVVPDVAAWCSTRMIPLPESNKDIATPDWILEFSHPYVSSSIRNAKRRIYAEAGVAFLWLLDPRTRSLEAFQLVAGKWLLLNTVEASDPVSIAPFDAISFPLSDLFPFDALQGAEPTAEG